MCVTQPYAQSQQRFCKALPFPSKGSPEPIVALVFDFTKEERVASNGERRFSRLHEGWGAGKSTTSGGPEKHAFLKLARDGLQPAAPPPEPCADPLDGRDGTTLDLLSTFHSRLIYSAP